MGCFQAILALYNSLTTTIVSGSKGIVLEQVAPGTVQCMSFML